MNTVFFFFVAIATATPLLRSRRQSITPNNEISFLSEGEVLLPNRQTARQTQPQNQQQNQRPNGNFTTTTTPSPRYSNCTRNCQSTSEYNPVCGSDGVTYNNRGRLSCAARCGASVTLLRGGTCNPL